MKTLQQTCTLLDVKYLLNEAAFLTQMRRFCKSVDDFNAIWWPNGVEGTADERSISKDGMTKAFLAMTGHLKTMRTLGTSADWATLFVTADNRTFPFGKMDVLGPAAP